MCQAECDRNLAGFSIWRCISCIGLQAAQTLGIIVPVDKTDILDMWPSTELEDLRDELTSAPYLSQAEVLVKAADSFRRVGHADISLELSRLVLQERDAALVPQLIMSQAVRSHALAMKALGKTVEAEDMLNMARYLHQSSGR